MDTDTWLSLLSLLLMLFGSACCAASETAFASVNKMRIKAQAENGDRRAIRAMYVLDNFDKAVTTVLICSNVLHIFFASLVTIIATRRWGLSSVAIATAAATVVVFFFAEMLPKSIAARYSERFSLLFSGALCAVMKVLSPFSFLLAGIGSAMARLTKGDLEVTVTEDELYDIIETMKDDGNIDAERGELVHSALLFAEVTAEKALTSRVDVDALDISSSPGDILRFIQSNKHSRLPVYERNIDNIVGILRTRAFLREHLRNGDDTDIRTLLEEPLFIHASANIDELLAEMSRRNQHMAIVTDNYGGTLGVITVEDIVEELVGDIWDEDDVVIERMVDQGDGSWDLDATLSLMEAFELFEREAPDEDKHTLLGEWVYEQFDFLPLEGDTFLFDGLEFKVSAMRQHRILRLRMSLPDPGGQGGGEEHA